MKTKTFFSTILAVLIMAIMLTSCTSTKSAMKDTKKIILTKGEVERLDSTLWGKQLFSFGNKDLILSREYIRVVDTTIDGEYVNEVKHFDTLILKINTEGVAKSHVEDTLHITFKSDTTIKFPFFASGINEEYVISTDYDKKVFCDGNKWDIVSGEGTGVYFKPLKVISQTTIMDGAKVPVPEKNEE